MWRAALAFAVVSICLELSVVQGACNGRPSSAVAQLKLRAVPYSPPNVAVKASWNPTAKQCVNQYMVRVRLASAPQGSDPYLTIVGTKSRASLENLRPKTTYTVEVVPVSKKYGLLPSVTATITTPDSHSCNPSIKPDKPIKVKARPVDEPSDSILLLYSAPFPYKACVTGFVVGAFDATTGERVFAATEGMEVRRTKVTGLKPGTLYNIYVGALWLGGSGDTALVQVTTNATSASAGPAAAYTAPKASRKAANKVTAGVAASATSTGKAAAAGASMNKPAPAATPAAAGAAPASVADAMPGCKHSQEPKAPLDFTATADGSSSIKLTYGNGDTSICTQFYLIDAYELKTGERVADIETVYNAYTLTGLRQGVEYVFTVSAVNSAGDSVPDTAYCTI